MFQGRIISRSNVNGKVHTFQKDFDDYDTYQKFVAENPEYDTGRALGNLWNPWSSWDRWLTPLASPDSRLTPVETKHLPEGVDLEKYERRRVEKRVSEAEKARKRQSLERSREYLEDYFAENPDDTEAKADLEKIEKELSSLA